MDISHRKVSFAQSWVLFFRNYAKFSGRSSRSAYWFWILWSVIIALVIGILRVFIIFTNLRAGGTGLEAEEIIDIVDSGSPIDIIESVWGLATIVPGLALAARRLHDVGRSGWWQLIVLTIVGIIPLFIWLVRAGDSDTNKYGDNVEQGLQ